MPYQVLPADPSDIPHIANIHHEAFEEDPILGRLMCDVPRESKYVFDQRFYEKAFAQRHLTGSIFYKVVDTETENLVAFAKWVYPYTLTSEQEAEKAKLDLERSYPEGTNVALYEHFFRTLDTKRGKNMEEGKDYFLHILAVSPNHQRRGLGKMLIQQGLAAADKDNARAYVEASAKGLGLYKKHGWKEIDYIEMDMRPHGGDRIEREELLMREPMTGSVQ
ncbi:MAG: hypothetical protein LQ341_007202 [Variospora aurantia]|nr:MAG: hypothetical protein LQ341_007202 [Variospora aurantia]